MADISKITLPNGEIYNIDAITVEGHTVKSDVPAGAVFTDTKDLNSMIGTLPVNKGGTGGGSAATARTNLGLGSVAIKDIDAIITEDSSSTNIPTTAAVANFIKIRENDIKSDIGDLGDLETTNKSSLVNAINEVVQSSSGSFVTVDSAMSSISTNPVQNKVINTEITTLKNDLGDLDNLETTAKNNLVAAINEVAQSGGSGALTQDTKQALLQCFAHTAWTDDQGQTYYDDLEDAFYPFNLLSTISAIYTQSGTVYNTDSLDSLKADLMVTGTYSDGTYNTIRDYTLSGTLTAGTSTITVTYGGKTATFTVTVTQSGATLASISANYTQSGTVYESTSLDSLKSDLVVTANWSDSTTTTIASADYTLSGALTVGTSTITVTYEGKTATFNVTVSQAAATLTSISAAYTQSGTVYDTDSLDSLKTDLVVTAHYSDSTTATVPATDYTLSGSLTVGTSTVTVSYSGKTTTFNVTVTAHSSDPAENWQSGVAYAPEIIQNEYYEKATGNIKTYNGWDRTDYMPCKGAEIIDISVLAEVYLESNAFFGDDFSVVQNAVGLSNQHPITIRVPSNAAYLGISGERTPLQSCVSDGITPYAPKSVSNMNGWANGVAYTNLIIVQNSYVDGSQILPYNGWDRTDHVPCNGLASITFPPLPQSSGTFYCCFYYKDKTFSHGFSLSKTENTTISVRKDDYWFIISSESAALASCVAGGIVPHTS